MYIVVEIQTTAEGKSSTIVTGFDTLETAQSKYHAVLAAAAVSSVPVHSAALLTNTGDKLASEFYRHDTVSA